MATIVVPDDQKIGKEQLLLGDLTITVVDCNGTAVELHGLMANDLLVKTLQGTNIPLTQYIINYAGANPNVTSSSVTNSKGQTVTLLEMADSIDNVQFTIADLQTKYNNL